MEISWVMLSSFQFLINICTPKALQRTGSGVSSYLSVHKCITQQWSLQIRGVHKCSPLQLKNVFFSNKYHPFFTIRYLHSSTHPLTALHRKFSSIQTWCLFWDRTRESAGLNHGLKMHRIVVTHTTIQDRTLMQPSLQCMSAHVSACAVPEYWMCLVLSFTVSLSDILSNVSLILSESILITPYNKLLWCNRSTEIHCHAQVTLLQLLPGLIETM